jgi:hypothetical protein
VLTLPQPSVSPPPRSMPPTSNLGPLGSLEPVTGVVVSSPVALELVGAPLEELVVPPDEPLGTVVRVSGVVPELELSPCPSSEQPAASAETSESVRQEAAVRARSQSL